MGYICARLIVLLADVRPYMGWYWLIAVALGIVVAVTLPWTVAAGAYSSPWLCWLGVGYAFALLWGMQYYPQVQFTPPRNVPAVLPSPPLWFVLYIAGLSAVTLTTMAVTLLILVLLPVEIIAPGTLERWAEGWDEAWLAWLRRRASRTWHPRPVDERFPARLRLEAPGVPAGRWLRGAIRLRRGSLVWEPAREARAAPVELTSATIVPGGAVRVAKGGRHTRAHPHLTRRAVRDAKGGRAITIDTPTGRIQLECDAELFTLLQHRSRVGQGVTADEILNSLADYLAKLRTGHTVNEQG